MFSLTSNRLPNTQSVGIDILSENVQSRQLNRFRSHPFKHLFTARCSVDWHRQTLNRHSHPFTANRQSLNRHSHPFTVHRQSLNRHSHLLTVHRQPLNRHSHLLTVHREPLNLHRRPFTVYRQPLHQLAMTSIQRKSGTIVCQSDDTIIKSIERYGSPSLGTVLYRGSSGVPMSLQPGANNNNGRP